MTTQQAHAPTPFDTVTVHPAPASGERKGGEDQRPMFSAEAMTRAARLGLLLFELSGIALALFFVGAALVWSDGVMRLGTLGVVVFGAMLANIWAVHIIFGSLLANNGMLGRSTKNRWLAAMTLTGPLAIFVYWLMHVWPAPYRPHHYSN